MAPCLSLASSFWLALTLLISPTTAVPTADVSKISCPTVTRTTSSPYCPPPTPSFCATPDCILLDIIDVPCGCPTIVPTSTSYTPCPTKCIGTCGTAYETVFASCTASASSSPTTYPTTPPTITSTKTTDTCVTITQTTGSNCPNNTCPVAECIIEQSITLECGCSSIYTATSCKTTCDGSCMTTYDTLYLPCPFSPPPVTTTVSTSGDTTVTSSVPVLTVTTT